MKRNNIIKLIIIFICILLIITLTIIYLLKNTLIFKKEDEITSDIKTIQDMVNNKISQMNEENISQYTDLKSLGIENTQYNDKIGISNGKVYIKDSSENKVKDAVQELNIGKEGYAKSEDGILVVDTYKDTEVSECKVINASQDIVNIVAFDSNNLCEETYTIGEIKDYKEIQENRDKLEYTRVAKNTTYTITNNIFEGKNIIFFFDINKKYIGSETNNTFTTDENTYYVKFITENEQFNGIEIMYNLVLGDKEGTSFDIDKTELSIDTKSNNDVYLPFNGEKTIIYSYGGDVEIRYVSK